MNLTEIQKIFIKKKISSILPDSKIYLFYGCEKSPDNIAETELMVFASRELNLEEKDEIRHTLWRITGDENLKLSSYRDDFESNYTKNTLIEEIKL